MPTLFITEMNEAGSALKAQLPHDENKHTDQ